MLDMLTKEPKYSLPALHVGLIFVMGGKRGRKDPLFKCFVEEAAEWIHIIYKNTADASVVSVPWLQ